MANLNLTPSQVVAGTPAFVRRVRAGATIVAGNMVAYDTTTKKYFLADSDHVNPNLRHPIGMALNNASDGQILAVMFRGVVQLATGAVLVPGTSYYASGTPGQICLANDVDFGQVICFVGIATNQNTMSLHIADSGVVNIDPAAPVVPFAFLDTQWSVVDLTTGGDIQISISSLPNNGNSTILDIQYQINSAGSWTSVGGAVAGAYIISGLTDDIQVTVRLRATNIVGAGAPSPTKNVTPTTAVVPVDNFGPSDWSITDLGTTGDAQITITALPSAPTSLTDIEYQIGGDPNAWVSLATATTGTYPISGLTDFTPTNVALRGVFSGGVGAGPSSAPKPVTTTPPATAPSQFATTDWTLTNQGSGSILNVNILAFPADNRSAITSVEYQVDSGAWQVLTSSATTGTYQVTGLASDQTVSVDIRAINAIGAGTASAGKFGTPSSGLNRTITITSGNGYAGSTYTSTAAGQWTADDVDIPGASNATYVLEAAYEGKQIKCGPSNPLTVWTPLALGPKLVEWWDARSGIVLNGSDVASWAGRKNGWLAEQPTAANQPAYEASNTLFGGRPAVVFTAANSEILLIASGTVRAQPFVRMGVGATTLTGVNAIMVDGNSASNRAGLYAGTTNAMNMFAGSTVPAGVVTSATPYMHVGVFRPSSLSFGRNTGVQGANGNAGTHTSRLGAIGGGPFLSSYYNGPIVMAVDCNDLTDDEIQRLEGYASAIWGITLPVGHTYKNNPPPLAYDSLPDNFSFTAVSGALANTPYESNTVTVSGLSVPAIVDVSSTVAYSKDGGAYTAGPGTTTAGNGTTFKLKVQSAGVKLTATSGTLNIGGKAATFTVTTENAASIVSPMSMFPEQIDRAYFQEDIVADGPVALWPYSLFGRRRTNASQGTLALQPTKLPAGGGVQFTAGATQYLDFGSDTDAYVNIRWWLVVARADLTAGSGTLKVFRQNGVSGGVGAPYRQPYVYFNNTANKLGSTTIDAAGSPTIEGACSTDYADWNVLLGFRRGNKIWAYINGTAQPALDFTVWRRQSGTVERNIIGDKEAVMGANMAVDCILLGDGELTDEQVDVINGWAAGERAKRRALLPGGHPYLSASPTDNDYDPATRNHSLFQFDQTVFNAWVAAVDADTGGGVLFKYSRRGESGTFSQTGYSRAFFTDWEFTDQYPAEDIGTNINAPWYHHGFITTLGGQASLVQGSGLSWPNTYKQDRTRTAGGAGRPGVLKMNLFNQNNASGGWRVGTVSNINNNGTGRWFGPGIYKTRYRFIPGLPDDGHLPGLFPGPRWSYSWEHMFFRKRNRIEYDYEEGTGKGGAWVEGSLHIHAPVIAGGSGVSVSDASKKYYGYSANASATSPIAPGGFSPAINIFDGAWHEHITKVIPSGTCVSWIDGIEVARFPWHISMATPQQFIVNHALDLGHGNRDMNLNFAETSEMQLDYFEVLYPDATFAIVPTGFSGRPTLSGTAKAGQTITCTPNTTPTTQIEYRWYVDGVPRTASALTSATYVVTADDVDKKLRCHVKNKALKDQPEAYTAELTILASYYVSATGSDAANGLTSSTPWLTIGKVNGTSLVAGDVVAFKGGDTFSGALVVPASGSSGSPIVFTSYGTGDATISAGTSTAVTITNRAYITVRNLILVGNGTTNAVDGLLCNNSQAGNTKLAGIILFNLDVSGFGKNGIELLGSNGTSGFASPLIENCVAHGNTFNNAATFGTSGIHVISETGYYFGTTAPAHTGLIIRGCTAYSNTGKAATSNWSGSGIFAGECLNGLIENCTAYSNGASNTFASGPVGIWFVDSDACVIRSCTSYSNLTGSGTADGGGFDLDGGCKNCIVEYCYSHDNFGAGFMIYSYSDSPLPASSGCVIRYCLSVNDGAGNGAVTNLCGIKVTADFTGQTGIQVYNNTIYNNLSGRACLYLSFTGTHGYRIANNIFYTAHAGAFCVKAAGNPTSALLQGNTYFGTATNKVSWNSVSYTTIPAWQAVITTQEKVSGVDVFSVADPQLWAPATAASPDNYKIVTGSVSPSVLTSPARATGQNLATLLSITNPTRDFFGMPVPNSSTVAPLTGWNMGFDGR